MSLLCGWHYFSGIYTPSPLALAGSKLTNPSIEIICYPASIFCGCWGTEKGKRMLSRPVEWNAEVSQVIPF
ncbi:conserved hypothetical protein [Microsporum canis CBS 113480]|uniref:Uncharacterized protein n=1 Tax=Arthroderma otae (strain ATCC MYA-4605 / CBS 113480) TaxID=554155 RepID=C5FLR2_ARTOC|nr:conserved hypothetical protein [Microsporum canis CBS 113480]EEQ30634.1 conserved hypothetical protein [Microsporum canis CBS 113480]